MMNFEIGVKHPTTPHLFADLVELLAIYDVMGKGGLHKNDVISIAGNLPVVGEDLDELEELEESQEPDALKNDKAEQKIEDLWTQLYYRASSFGGYYPFEIKGDSILLVSDWSCPKHRVYRFLLAASRLRSFDKSIRGRWAKVFCEISADSLKALLPSFADVKIFDANSHDRHTYYGTDCRKALQVLGRQICAHDIHYKSLEKLSPSGDGGIDLVGVAAFNDEASGSHVFFGQCGAQEKEWPSKILEAHSDRVKTYFHILHGTVTTMFIPVAYRMANGDWVNDRSVTGALVLDRLRILNLLDKNNFFMTIVGRQNFVDFESQFTSYNVDI